ncbi:uncharacterized protein LOC142544239 [Primulina tabacum]|uniref:uncharacterized protein LOC142544239 n=1 Tax=Primulina tabacum TaxID=48773 RepID=UPI003F5A5A4E
MNELRAVASTYHQKIKFPVGARVGDVRGDQLIRAKTKREGKKARVNEVGGRVVEKGEVHFVAEEEQEMDKVIDEQVKELLKDGHIREIQFPTWLSNVVLVPKSTGKWRMYVDFRDLNKACPKDHYPLPRIDQLVDSTSGFELFSFIDAYQGYNQIPLAKRATYQRLMNKVFEKQLGRNVEVYVDDILGKSKEVADFIIDLEETFATLMHYGIKLNPAKCIFGVKSGKFLGFIVTDRGIEVNQEKVKSVLCMTSPRSVKEVQKLTGRIASLSRFISRSAHKSYPFFQVLRKAQQFGWDEKCEQDFQDLKIHLAELPVLVKPEPGEKLFVYISTTKYAVSSVLIKEEGSDQKHVYYVSHALRGPELRYSEIEKDHDSFRGIRMEDQVDSRAGGEYDIRVAIKAKALSDFLSEMVQPEEEEVWRVFVDGASSLAGFGVGVVIISPSGEKIKLALRIDSRITNNEVEYEAVLAGIQTAWEVGASRIILYSDSQLITQQIKGVYEAKDDRMLKYLQLIKARAEVFADWGTEQVTWEENGEADTLAKMAASLSAVSTREVLHVSRLILSTEEEIFPVPGESWMTPLIKFMVNNELPEDRTQAQKTKRQAPMSVLLNNMLYRRSFQEPLLKCLWEKEVDYILREIHEGCCVEHLGGMSLA